MGLLRMMIPDSDTKEFDAVWKDIEELAKKHRIGEFSHFELPKRFFLLSFWDFVAVILICVFCSIVFVVSIELAGGSFGC